MLSTALATINANRLIAPGDTVVVALSGGPDSVALFHVLLRLRGRLSFSVCAAHLNHRLRGRDSDEDERFVKTLAQKSRVPLITESRDVKGIRKNRGGSIEEVAREVRYAFLARAAGKLHATKIALGHNMDDNVETLIMNLMRGSGLRGLSGMPVSRTEGECVIIRPLLGVTRGEILSYLNEHKLRYREDITNLDTSFTRNRIRHHLLPLLASDYNPQIRKVLAEAVVHLRDAEECVSAVMELLEKECLRRSRGRLSLDMGRLKHYPQALWREFFRRVVGRELGLSFERRTLDEVCQLVAGTRTESIGLGRGFVASREYEKLLFLPEEKLTAPPFEKKLRLPCDVFLSRFGVQISASFAEAREVEVSSKPHLSLGEIWERIRRGARESFEELFDASAIRGNSIVVRSRAEGDEFRPLGMKGNRKVKELFIDEKVPVTLRNRIPIFCSGNQIMWVVGYRPAAEFAVKKSTRKILRVMVKVLYCRE